jgi:hypothetical protein
VSPVLDLTRPTSSGAAPARRICGEIVDGRIAVFDGDFDGVIRRTTNAMSRRASVFALGSVALSGLTGTSVRAGKKGKKCNKKIDKTCKKQKGVCEASMEAFCEGQVEPAECQQACRPCCATLATCNAGASTECLLGCFS